jgi:branched-chain amino acid transport system substrate-binding protein
LNHSQSNKTDMEEMMTKLTSRVSRRSALKRIGAAGAAATFGWLAVPRTVKIGLVVPQTGPLAIFSEQVPWVVAQIKKINGGQIDLNGTKHPLELGALTR